MLALGLGVWLVVFLVRELGADEIASHVRSLSATLPALFALELGRFLSEMMATRLAIGPLEGTRVPALKLLRGQSLAHACNKIMPAGRAIGEGLKAAVLAPAIGTPSAIGVGAALQIMTVLVNGGFALAAGVAAALVLAAPKEAWVMTGYGMLSMLVGVGIVLSLRSPWLSGQLSRFKLTASLRGPFAEAVARGTGFGLGAITWHAASKLAQVAQLAVLLAASGVVEGLAARAVLAEGIQIVGAAAGDLVPAQVGATEGAFTLLADALAVSAQSALSVAVVLHGTQLTFAAGCFCAAAVFKAIEATVTAEPSLGAGPAAIGVATGPDVNDEGK